MEKKILIFHQNKKNKKAKKIRKSCKNSFSGTFLLSLVENNSNIESFIFLLILEFCRRFIGINIEMAVGKKKIVFIVNRET